MTSAYMKQNHQGKWETTIRNVKGEIVKVVPTPKSQIRLARISCLFQPHGGQPASERIGIHNNTNIFKE